jgi:hypothetical protein
MTTFSKGTCIEQLNAQVNTQVADSFVESVEPVYAVHTLLFVVGFTPRRSHHHLRLPRLHQPSSRASSSSSCSYSSMSSVSR